MRTAQVGEGDAARERPRSTGCARTARPYRIDPVAMKGAQAPREVPSTHSAYAVTDSARGTPETLRTVSREIFTGSASGTYCSRSSWMPWAWCCEPAVAEAVARDVGAAVAHRLRGGAP
jgi:hypothetical protein